MKRAISYLLMIIAFPLGIAELRHYRVNSVLRAATEFAPRSITLPAVPAGTRIKAILKSAFTESTNPGERVVAFTTEPVVVQGQTAVTAGTQLDGFVEQITMANGEAVVVVHFLSVDADAVVITAPVRPDVELMASALDTVAEAGVGIALGAASSSERGAVAGMALGALNAASVLDRNNKEIIVVLTKTLPARTIVQNDRTSF